MVVVIKWLFNLLFHLNEKLTWRRVYGQTGRHICNPTVQEQFQETLEATRKVVGKAAKEIQSITLIRSAELHRFMFTGSMIFTWATSSLLFHLTASSSLGKASGTFLQQTCRNCHSRSFSCSDSSLSGSLMWISCKLSAWEASILRSSAACSGDVRLVINLPYSSTWLESG